MLGHVGLALGKLASGQLARLDPAGVVGIQRTHRDAVHAARRHAEQLFHLAVAVQGAAALDHGDAQHRVVEDGAVFHQRLAQRLLVAALAGAVLEHPDRALVGVFRIDLVADHLDPGRRAVLAHQGAGRSERPAEGQFRIGLGAELAVRCFVRVDHARGHPNRLALGIAEHLAEGGIGAPDHAVAGKHDANRGIGHDRLHLAHGLARLGHVLDDPDGAGAAVARFNRAAAQPRPEGAAVAAAELLLALLEQAAPGQHRERFADQLFVILGREADLGRRDAPDLFRREAEHLAGARIEGADLVRLGDGDADRRVLEHGALLAHHTPQRRQVHIVSTGIRNIS